MDTDTKRPELLAPAGEPDSGYAALEYGADALYLGMNRFSARAEAVNFSPDELADLAGYAHSLSPRRNVYLTLNTLIQQSELADAAGTLLTASECGIDAVIVQDPGAVKLVRDRFPALKLHASTQMAVHSLEGALAAKALGCRRVTLARELTLGEIRNLVAGVGPDFEVETFIHGTLCYSYSGLCLFSSIMSGRSGNRGRCVYSCREAAGTPAGRAHPFSLKDLALGERVLDLAGAGVSSLKIEGRKKSPLYVAATVDHYRRILDGELSGREAAGNEARLKTIFARPWTRFFLDSKHNPDAADPHVVGHRGSRIGTVERLLRTPSGKGIAFTPSLPIERHDGLQVDMPGEARPFGFAVDSLFAVRGARMEPAFAASAGTPLAVPLPEDSPALSPGLPLYLSSSQAVKRAFPFTRPKPGAFIGGMPVSVEVSVAGVEPSAGGGMLAVIRGTIVQEASDWWSDADPGASSSRPACSAEASAPAYAARDAAGPEKAARAAFERLGGSPFRLEGWRFVNPDGLFVKPGDWNRLRRRMIDQLTSIRGARTRAVCRGLAAAQAPGMPAARRPNRDGGFAWSVFAGDPAFLSSFTAEDFGACREVIVDIGFGPRDALKAVDALSRRAGAEKIRLALPVILRADDVPEIMAACSRLIDANWRRWMVPGLAGWQILRSRAGLDLSADWMFNSLNIFAVNLLAEMGFTAFTMSPEDDARNMAELAALSGDRGTAVVFSHLPLFISAACAHAHLGLCNRGETAGERASPRHAASKGSSRGVGCETGNGVLKLAMERGAAVEVVPQRCGSVVVGEKHYSLAERLPELSAMGVGSVRADFRWRSYAPGEALEIWRAVRGGGFPGGMDGNFAAKLI